MGEVAAVLLHLVGGLAVDVGVAGGDEVLGALVHLVEVVGGVERLAAEVGAQPLHGLDDGVDVLLLFLLRVGVVEAQVAGAAVFPGEAEVEQDGLGVPEVQVAVGLRGEAGADLDVLARRQISFDHLLDEIRSRRGM